MRRIEKSLLVAIAVSAAGLAACGGKHVDFPVDNSKVISTLTVADAQAMCKSMVDSAQSSMDLACLAQGVSAKFASGGTEQTCKTTIDKCTAEMQMKKVSCDGVGNKEFEGCGATVGEYETCLNDALALADKLSGQLSCSMSQADMMKLAAELESMPPSCQSFSQKCPKLMSSSSDTGTIP